MTEIRPASIINAEERARRIREESARIEAETAAREKDRLEREKVHQTQARLAEADYLEKSVVVSSHETREMLWERINRLRTEPVAPPPPTHAPRTPRQQAEMEAEIAAGQRALARHNERVTAQRELTAKVSAEERAKQENDNRKREGYSTPVYVDPDFVPGFTLK